MTYSIVIFIKGDQMEHSRKNCCGDSRGAAIYQNRRGSHCDAVCHASSSCRTGDAAGFAVTRAGYESLGPER